jgi:glycosyltransferase involved in cell wall biosynthesis
MHVWIVIGAYDEAHSIGSVLKELVKAGYKNVIVVDDGSDDTTARIARQYTKHVLQHKINRGQGAALKTGIDYALSQDADVIVTFDADGQHRVEDIPRVIEPVKTGKVDVSLGSRFLSKGTEIPFFRKLVLKTGIWVVWLFYGIKLTDVHNGFRAFSSHAAEMIDITMDRMEHASEILSEIKKNHLRFVEVPVIIKYTEYSKQHGQSSFNAIKIFYRMLLHKLTK